MAHSMTGKVKAANDVIKELKGLVMMRKLASSFLLLVVTGCVLTGCGQSILREAEALLETDLKAADSILTSMPVPKTRRDRAWYAVLKTQSDYKNYRPLTDNSLILSATEYYGTKHKSYQAAMAWYSLGCSYTDANNDLAAINAYLKARDLFPDTLIRYYALTEQNLGKHYLNRMMLPEATEQYKCCLINSIRVNDDRAKKNAIYKLGCCALYSKDFSKADSIFNFIVTDNSFSLDQKITAKFQLSKIRLHYDKDYHSALELINEYLFYHNRSDNSGAGLSVKADIYNEMGQFDSAYYYYSKSLDYSNDINTLCSNYDYLALTAIELGHKDEAIQYYNGYKNTADSIYELRNQEHIRTLESEHRTELAENQLHNRTIRFTIIIVSMLIIMVFVLLYIYSTFKHREKERIMKRQQKLQKEGEAIRKSTIELLESKIKDYSTQDPEARAVLLKSYSNRLQMCTNAFRATPEYKMLSSYRLSVKELNRNDRDELFNQIKRSYLESITDIRIEIPDIGEKDILTVILRNQGLSIEQISSLFSITTDSVKKRLYRLSQRASSDFLNIYGV